MIGAISFRYKKNCKAKIYLVGTYEQIDWCEEHSCELGEKYSTFEFKHSASKINAMTLEKGLDGEYILRLIETRRYVLKVEGTTGETLELPYFQNEGNKFLRCDKDKDSILFQFVNYLGRSRVVFNCGEFKNTLLFEVIPDKMGYEEDYIQLTEALAQVCAELLLDHTGSTSNVFEQSEDDTLTLLEQFIFLRQFCYSQNICSLFEAIKRNPDRVLVCDEEIKPFGYGIPSKKLYSKPFVYGRGWERVKSSETGSTFYLPREVAIVKKHDNKDTPANRFIQFAFQKFQSICQELISILTNNGEKKQTECLKEAIAMDTMLNDILLDSFWDEIRPFDFIIQNNQALQKREGYAQIFSAYSMIDLALQLNWRGKDNVYEGESKNVALLYEYWLFFELYKIINSIDGCEVLEVKDNPFLINNKEHINIFLKQGEKSCQSFRISRLKTNINLYYNRRFSNMEFRTTKYEGSYSRPFRPDYTIAIYPDSYQKGKYNGEADAIRNGAVSYVHFDAKYRITDLTALVGKNDSSINDEGDIIEDKIESVINTYNRGDLLKMHTYNDAIRRTIGSYVLYPGAGGTVEKDFTTFSLYDEILPGVGAFAIKPSIEVQGEAELKRFVTMIIESKVKNYSRLNRMRYYTEMILREPSIAQLDIRKNELAKDKQNNKEMPFETDRKMCVLGYIRADSEKDYYYSLKNRNLLTKGGRFLFYFYAIKGNYVYTHHKDITNATNFLFYTNQISKTGTYKLEPVLCKIDSNELLSCAELVRRLKEQGYNTDEKRHHADFYYALTVSVVEDNWSNDEMKVSEINGLNGNDTFSPHSPKVIYY